LNQLLDRDRLKRQQLFDPTEIHRRIAEHQSGAHDHRKPLWTLLVFQLWWDQWIGRV
jgi:asparagine synthase (glutamine-hydrolysing)